MPMTKAAWAKIPPEERKRRMGFSHRAIAVRVVTEQWELFTDEQREAIENVVLGLDGAQ